MYHGFPYLKAGRLKSKACPECGGPLDVQRSWRQTFLRCRSCSRRFTVEQIADAMDDDLEEQLANIPCNRL